MYSRIDVGVGVGVGVGDCKDVSVMTPVLTEPTAAESDMLPLSQYSEGGDQTTRMEGEGWGKGDNNVLALTSSGPDFDAFVRQCSAPTAVFTKLKKQFYELRDATILRHMLVCNCDADKTAAHLEDMMVWRQATINFTARPKDQTRGNGCVFYTHGSDAKGHPLLIFTTRLLDLKTRDLDESVRWFLYMVEIAIARLPPHLEQITILVNRIGKIQRTDFEFSKKFFPLLNCYYPNRVHKVLWFPVSPGLRAMHGIVEFVGGRASGNKVLVPSVQALWEEVPKEYIPIEMGGSCRYEFNLEDYPIPVVCEPYKYIRLHRPQMTVSSPVASINTTGSASLRSLSSGSSEFDNSDQERNDDGDEPLRANSIVGTYSYMVSLFRPCVDVVLVLMFASMLSSLISFYSYLIARIWFSGSGNDDLNGTDRRV